MLGFNTNSNNMYINQNYGYGQSAMNTYQQQQSLLFTGDQYAKWQQQQQQQQQTSVFGGYSQQPSYDPNFMMLSMINSMLPVMLGLISNQQPVVQRPPVVQQPPMIQQPQQNSSSGFLQQLVMMLLQNLLGTGSPTAGRRPVEIYDENVTVDSWGDPHFSINGKQSFDFQGKNEGLYKMIDNSDIALNAKFTGGGEGAATIINSQNLEFKDAGINLVTHADGKFEIIQDGKEIGDETNYDKDEKLVELLKKNDINLKKEGNVLTTTHGKRTISQRFNGGNIDNINNNLMKGDEGLLTQTVGAIDEDKDGITKLGTDVNKDGKVDEKDNLQYDIKNQFMVHTAAEARSAAPITAEIEAAIKKDIADGIKKGSAVKGFSTEHGYDARQWNEYLGAKLYSVKEDELLAAK
ncbi:MAG: hypothetical protein A2039_01075 [Candidatus Melainabacteria bacterium GWA2_34_9]|nr:MAG: hypothetical protein A2039_01075 [Candidatus Melainabacteria bacterium GWA2_34_9]